MYVCMYVYIYIRMYVCMYVNMYVCVRGKGGGGSMSPRFFAVFQFHGSWTCPTPNVPFVERLLLILQSFDWLAACRVSRNITRNKRTSASRPRCIFLNSKVKVMSQ
jgi:hypothetical protein